MQDQPPLRTPQPPPPPAPIASQDSDKTRSELIRQVQLSNDTLQLAVQKIEEQNALKTQQLDAAINRLNQTSDLYLDKTTEITQLGEQLQSLKEEFLVALEALHKTINESDRNLDDQAKITQRIGQMELTYRQALQEANARNA